MRTTADGHADIEETLRGSTAGFNTAMFVMDAPGGGGKRDALPTSTTTGDGRVGVLGPGDKARPAVYYFDPIDRLPPGARRAGPIPGNNQMLEEARQRSWRSAKLCADAEPPTFRCHRLGPQPAAAGRAAASAVAGRNRVRVLPGRAVRPP